jgi:hypothetical protein
VIDALDAGASFGEIRFYDGARPATGGLVTALLATCTLSDPSASVTTGVITFNPITDDVSADADGIITWARFLDSNETFVMDVSCGIAGSGADILFNTTQTKVGGAVQIISAVITEGSV